MFTKFYIWNPDSFKFK